MIRLSMANVLAGDVGGTNTRLGIFERRGPRPTLVATRTYGTRAFETIEAMATAFLRDVGVQPSTLSAGCFGAAGPVLDGVATLTNTPVRVDSRAIANALGLTQVTVLNDLEALAYALPVLAGNELGVLQEGRRNPSGAVAIIAAGTGLGEAVLHSIGDRLVAKASEAGRSDFAARTERDIVVLRAVTRTYGRAAVEHVVSGPGLVNIHKALEKRPCEAGVDMSDSDAPGAIATSARASRCPACVESVATFVEAYGAEAGNLALRSVATGGVYVGGGIAPKMMDRLTDGAFVSAFRAKPPFAMLLESIPVKVILNSEAGLLGAAHFCLLS
ncbi:MAG TPA: glucokinase [Vicinamibacterales bacterium]|nr:glucokinase [Vicinamibacterales bacterium]